MAALQDSGDKLTGRAVDFSSSIPGLPGLAANVRLMH